MNLKKLKSGNKLDRQSQSQSQTYQNKHRMKKDKIMREKNSALKVKKEGKGSSRKSNRQCDISQMPIQEIKTIHPELIQYLGYGFHKITLNYKFLLNELLKDLNLHGPLFSILLVMRNSKNMNQATLGDELGIDKATMVKFLDQLEEFELLERVSDQNDRRVKNLKLTEKGRNIVKKALEKREQFERDFLNCLSEEEVTQLKNIMRKILTKISTESQK